MSKIVFNKIIAKLEKLDKYLGYLENVQKANRKSFIKDYSLFGSAERFLQLSIEIILDIGKLIVISKNFKKPEDNKAIFLIMYENKVISKKLYEELVDIANFRNILVHVYEKIDRNVVYDKLQNNLVNFKDFKKEITRFVNKNF